MPTQPFVYQELFELGQDTTEYRLLTKDFVGTADFQGRQILTVAPDALTLLSSQAFHDINFFLRPAHLKQVAAILDDSTASDNDRMVALTMLKNADVASAGVLPFCQDTGTATIMGKKGHAVWSSGDEEALSKGVYQAYTENNLRYSQNAPLTMWDEKNTNTNLLLRLICMPAMAMTTSFCSSLKVVARPTNRICTRRHARFSIQRHWLSF